MFHFSLFTRTSLRPPCFSAGMAEVAPVIALPFLAGIVSGVLIGLYSDVPQALLASFGLFAPDDAGTSFFHAFWRSSRFILFASFMGSAVFGVLTLPLLSALRAFSFACSIAAVMRPSVFPTVLISVFSFGLPALMEFPAFFLAETDGFRFSRGLLLHEPKDPEFTRTLPCHLLIALILCAADAAYIYFLLPQLLSRIA